MRYPIVLMAPDAFETASDHPIGTGPFKFVSWTRWNETRLVRFENYWETDAEGNSLPYLDEIVVKLKREDSVRLTALRTGQVHLINDMAQADVERFKRSTATNITVGIGFRRQLYRLQLSARQVSGQTPAHRGGACHRPQRHPSGGVLREGRDPTNPTRPGMPGTWRVSAAWSTTPTVPRPCSRRRARPAPRSRSSPT